MISLNPHWILLKTPVANIDQESIQRLILDIAVSYVSRSRAWRLKVESLFVTSIVKSFVYLILTCTSYLHAL